MNRNRQPNHKAAGLACAAVAYNSNGSRIQPALAAISGYAANPQVGFSPRLFSFHISGMAAFATKAQTRFAFVLMLNPRLYCEILRALRAIVHIALDCIHAFSLFASKSISGAQARSPSVSDLVGAWHFTVSHVPFPPANLAAKPCGCRPVWLHLKSVAAYLARFINHGPILTRNYRHSRIEQAHAQGQLFEPVQPKQEQVSLV